MAIEQPRCWNPYALTSLAKQNKIASFTISTLVLSFACALELKRQLSL